LLLDDPHVPVEDILIVVVLGLDDLVPNLKPLAEPLDAGFGDQ